MVIRGLIYVFVILSLFLGHINMASGQAYIIQVQTERDRSRFTLTEWLRIKERMRMMDLWLAMFSNPQKDPFRPELNLSYKALSGVSQLTGATGISTYRQPETALSAQVFLTNLVTSSTGLRTINIDFGIEGSQRQSRDLTLLTGSDDRSLLPKAKHYAGLFRLFGKHIQDSSLIVKFGQYDYPGHLAWEESQALPLHGLMAGAELSLYLSRWLGFEGQYQRYGDDKGLSSDKINGVYSEYAAYIEISLLRVMVGPYFEKWKVDVGGEEKETESTGLMTGIKLQI